MSPYPALAESFFMESQEGALPCAGSDVFCNAGERVKLDCSATALRPGRSIASVKWLLSDGSVVEGETAEIKHQSPGFYAEEMRITLDDGQELRDAARVRVFKPGVKGQAGFKCWLCKAPLKGVSTGSELFFKLMDAEGASIESVDFGDGSEPLLKPRLEFSRSYSASGLYTVLLKGSFNGVPLMIKSFVRVERP